MPKPSTEKAKVQWVLERSKKSRDNNLVLYKNIFKHFLKIDLNSITGYDLLKGIKHKKYPNYDSVTRASRKLQELNPELRGAEWEARHGKPVDETIKDLKQNF